MTKHEETRPFVGKSANDCYDAILRAFPKAKFNVWKERKIAWLVMAKRKEGSVEIDANLSAGFGTPTPITVHISAEDYDQAALAKMAEEIFAALTEELK